MLYSSRFGSEPYSMSKRVGSKVVGWVIGGSAREVSADTTSKQQA